MEDPTSQASQFAQTKISVFDLDDTLFEMRSYILGAFSSLDNWVHAELGLENFSHYATYLYNEGLRGTIFNEVLTRNSIPFDSATIAEMLALYRSYTPDGLSLYPDAQAYLEELSGRPTALITDGNAQVQRAKVHALGLHERFPVIVFTDELGEGKSKPHPEAFEIVMKFHKASPSECLYIGDNPHKDFTAPKALGWKTLRLRRPNTEHTAAPASPGAEPDAEFESLDPLLNLAVL